MAGGKETPRQKMIGMMYLVLTALLALNVSKSILDAFVAMDNNIQDGTKVVVARANELYNGVKAVAENTAEPDRAKAAKKFMPLADYIRDESDKMVDQLHGIKDEIIKKIGDDPKKIKTTDDSDFTFYNTAKISAKDNYDVPMQVVGIANSIKKPDGKGKKLWDNYIGFRDGILNKLGEQDPSSFKAANMSIDDLEKGVKDIKDPVLKSTLKNIYGQLYIKEKADMHGGEIKDVPWVGRTFDHAPSVAALAQLSSLEQKIRTAEANALGYVRSQIGSSDYSFNEIIPLAFSKSNYYNSGDSIEVKVMMAAYDSYNRPEVTYRSDSTAEAKPVAEDNIKEGQGYVYAVAEGAGPQELSGEITIKKKNGESQTLEWEYPYTVGTPTGAISLPEMNVLYRGYNNKVKGAVSGYTDYSLSMSNGSISKSGDTYIAKPGGGREATISITGIAADGSQATVGQEKFRVRNLPNPTIKLGSLWDGDKASAGSVKAMTRLFAQYPPEIPLNAKFNVVSYTVKVTGAPRSAKGTGSALNGAAQSLIRQARSGASIVIETDVKGPDGRIRRKNGVITVK